MEYLKRTKFCKPVDIITNEMHSRRGPFKMTTTTEIITNNHHQSEFTKWKRQRKYQKEMNLAWMMHLKKSSWKTPDSWDVTVLGFYSNTASAPVLELDEANTDSSHSYPNARREWQYNSLNSSSMVFFWQVREQPDKKATKKESNIIRHFPSIHCLFLMELFQTPTSLSRKNLQRKSWCTFLCY